MSRTEFHIDVTTPDTPVNLLAAASGLSRQQIKQAMQKGAVWLGSGKHTRRLRRQGKTLSTGQSLHFYYDPEILASSTLPATLIADEDAYSVWHKPYGMLSQGSRWGDHTTINRWAETQLSPERPAFLVHRLDRATSGLILIAHQKKAARALAGLFEERQLEKRYRAIVHGRLEQACQIDQAIDGKAALSHVHSVAYNNQSQQSLLEIHIETGRKHQVRKHLAHIGLPIVGDRLHGGENDGIDLQLCAFSLAFTCPITGTERHYSLENSPFELKL